MYLFNNSICQLILSFQKCIYVIAQILLQLDSSYFSKMAFVGFQYEPVSLDVNNVVCFEEQDIPNMHQKSKQSKQIWKMMRNANEC